MFDIYPARFVSKIKVNEVTGCWEWQAGKTSGGYARYKLDGKTRLGHRVSYRIRYGEIPNKKMLDHLCRNHKCVNPEHLEPVTPRENVMRGNTIVAVNAAKTHCIHGHLLEGKNLFIRKNGSRRCQECERQYQKRLKQRPESKQRHALCERNRRARLKLLKESVK